MVTLTVFGISSIPTSLSEHLLLRRRLSALPGWLRRRRLQLACHKFLRQLSVSPDTDASHGNDVYTIRSTGALYRNDGVGSSYGTLRGLITLAVRTTWFRMVSSTAAFGMPRFPTALHSLIIPTPRVG